MNKSTYKLFLALFILATSIASCRKDPAVAKKDCKLTFLHDESGTFGNNTMTFEYDADGRIAKIDGSQFNNAFEFHDDSVTINFYDHFQSLASKGVAKLNSQGLIEWEKDSSFWDHSVRISIYSYDNHGFLLYYLRQGTDTVSYRFTYSNGNAVSASVLFYEDNDSLLYSFEYFESTINNLLILPDPDEIMLSGLYGKISTNLIRGFTISSTYGGFGENYEYEFDDHGNPTKRYKVFMGDTLGNTTFQWNCDE